MSRPLPFRCTLHAGWLIDGSGGETQQAVGIEIRGGLIQSISRLNPLAAGIALSPEEQFLDFRDCTVLPGLIDSHVHLTMAGAADRDVRSRLLHASSAGADGMILENLRQHLQHGVVAVRDAGGACESALRFSKKIRDPVAHPVQVAASGRAWHRQGRYGRFIGRTPASGSSLADAIGRDSEGGDQVKILQSGLNSMSDYGRQTAPQFDIGEMSAAVRVAKRQERSVMAHANGEAPVRIAVLSGCQSVEHGFFMGPDNLERMAENGVVWVPTAVTMQAHVHRCTTTGCNPDVARRTLDHQLQQLFHARRMGVTVALGTDSGSPGVHHGAALIAEMRLLMQAGFSLPEAVRCASANGAGLIGADHGVLAPGRPATFVVVGGGPSELPESLATLKAVIIMGIKKFEGETC